VTLIIDVTKISTNNDFKGQHMHWRFMKKKMTIIQHNEIIINHLPCIEEINIINNNNRIMTNWKQRHNYGPFLMTWK
jgi:hypothetical protein